MEQGSASGAPTPDDRRASAGLLDATDRKQAGDALHPGGSAYRPDIDGLRAISVLSVLLFHISPSHVPAGAIGVDIFFVISGYLIGGLLLDRFARGTFSYADFYMRRIRRIMPALLVMNLATLAAGLLIFFPDELVALAWSALYSLVGLSNVYFYFHSDYFGDNSSAGLLHTWSLGVEEQFYVLLPPLIALSVRVLGARWVVAVIAALLAASLVASEHLVRIHSPAAFYLIHSRAWELAIGVLFAGWRLPRTLPPAAATALAVIGLALVGFSLVLLHPDQGFPGLMAVPPCLGAALLLASGAARPTIVHRLLAIQPARWIGLASYSIYLWHWPIILFTLHVLIVGKLTPASALAVGSLSLAMGFLSWRFVETPLRDRRLSARRVLQATSAMLAIVGAIAVVIIATGGLPDRIPPRARALAALQVNAAGFTMPADHCFAMPSEPLSRYDAAKCLTPNSSRPNWLLVGDSHAAMLYGALTKAFPQVHLMAAVSYGCAIAVDAADDGMACNGLMHMIFADYLAKHPIDGVIITSRGTGLDAAQLAALKRRLDPLHIKLLVIGPTPDFSAPVARILAEADRRHDPALPGRILGSSPLWEVDAALAARVGDVGAAYASPVRAMCPTRATCIVADPQGQPLYTDSSHYSDAGALTMIRRLIARDAVAGGPLGRTIRSPARDAPAGASRGP